MAIYGIECCPYLGLKGDSSSYQLYPSAGGCCLAGEKHTGIVASQQEEYCLTRNYVGCARLAQANRGAEDTSGRLYLPLWATVIVIFLTVGAAWGILALIDRVEREVPAGPALISEAPQSGAGMDGRPMPAAHSAGQSNTGPVGVSATSTVTSTATARSTAALTVMSTATLTPMPSFSPTAPSVRAAPTPSPGGRTEYYVVQPGDTLGSIARFYGVSTDVLAQANGMRQDDLLQADVRLVIPISGTLHIVQVGDTLSDIAQKYGVSPDEIAVANRLSDGDVISIGQRLVIPNR